MARCFLKLVPYILPDPQRLWWFSSVPCPPLFSATFLPSYMISSRKRLPEWSLSQRYWDLRFCPHSSGMFYNLSIFMAWCGFCGQSLESVEYQRVFSWSKSGEIKSTTTIGIGRLHPCRNSASCVLRSSARACQ